MTIRKPKSLFSKKQYDEIVHTLREAKSNGGDFDDVVDEFVEMFEWCDTNFNEEKFKKEVNE